MRLFAALVPPDDVLDELAQAIAPHVGQVPGLRWPARDTWHITLGFFGEVPERVLPDLQTRLERAVRRHPAPNLTFDRFGAFSSPRRARVLWAGVTGDPMTRLADSVRAAARRAGATQTDEKRFHPHLTLARAKTETDLRPLVESLSGFTGSPWRAERVRLVRSHMGAQVRYESLAEWALAPAGQG
ncbi:2'-5' RNA ligase [[Actinomadura] parvosata subsp. kistnae]|uniref:RNA 2',3'-cyclic phosphodiesterase n=1 Tax=[Actinomadura] parvosata subsp. kistnae TaxID=1909395 RepID=A0A1V0ADS8_9ACTN|nr:RNA 2',3'-cyclic phosphodiesterase [Nonomuraea sp. ATCC 55076]AQZ68368.1 2'-5' RNA ligase [Nonomuraea sp. ATCC 55076]SPL93198.1 2'-5' RNA ligase [Actinomadura parvosata subsp. kistnae]